MSARRLADLSSSEVSAELARVGLQVAGKHVGDRERLLRLASFLIDKGQDPLSHEFPEYQGQEQSDNSDKARQDRRLLLDRVVKIERRYFNFSVEASSSTEAAPAQDKIAFKTSLKRDEEQQGRGL